jgi:Na+-transporting methylmalonyl-CoA/oxaloacetate decarboxylase gamma subunit
LLAAGPRGLKTMDKWAFGFTMMIVGVGGTFLTLAILILTINILKKIFPFAPNGDAKKS